jgi:transposase
MVNEMKRLVLENKTGIINQIRCYLDNNSEAKFIHRLQVILMFAGSEDESCDSLGSLFGNSPRSVSNWIKRINQTGDIESLRNKPSSGRPSRLTKSQKEELKTVIREFPEKRGMQGRKWNGINLSLYISQHYGITLKVRSCQRLFHELTAI